MERPELHRIRYVHVRSVHPWQAREWPRGVCTCQLHAGGGASQGFQGDQAEGDGDGAGEGEEKEDGEEEGHQTQEEDHLQRSTRRGEGSFR